ncbi:MAG: ATP phosphoribosyltransferase, partial [Bacteroidales bacterium]|nr:ATP phosphoribosyltransferase [Bacteroidales bacterium]
MLRLAIQSKGRLNEDSTALLREIGIDIDDSRRKFLAQAPNFPLELLYMRDDDIPQVVSSGTAALGIVGLNEVVERGFPVQVVKKLGFGSCRISLAVPKSVDYPGPQWFAGKRIATSYPGILRSWLQEQGIEARIEVITGSVEIAPAADIADAIFDIVSSGGTLITNGLREVEKVFFSEAVLISSGKLSAEEQQVLDEMLFRIDSAMISRHKKYILMNLPRSAVEEATRILPAMRSPTVMPLAAEGWCSMHSVVEEAGIWDKIQQLKAIGAEGILVL